MYSLQLQKLAATISAENEHLRAERDKAQLLVRTLENAVETSHQRTHALSEEQEKFMTESATLRLEMEGMQADRDETASRILSLESEKELLMTEKEAMLAQMQSLMCEKEVMQSELNELQLEIGTLKFEKESVIAASSSCTSSYCDDASLILSTPSRIDSRMSISCLPNERMEPRMSIACLQNELRGIEVPSALADIYLPSSLFLFTLSRPINLLLFPFYSHQDAEQLREINAKLLNEVALITLSSSSCLGHVSLAFHLNSNIQLMAFRTSHRDVAKRKDKVERELQLARVEIETLKQRSTFGSCAHHMLLSTDTQHIII